MKAVKIKSKIDGMFTWAILDNDGTQHEIHKSYDETYYADGLDLSHSDIRKLLTNARASASRKAREQAYKDCGLVKVKGALGGTYWE